jgi:alpha-L-fucosidase
MGFYARPDLFPVQETYALIRSLQPQTLISFKQGASGDEDFAAPERKGESKADEVMELFGPDNARVAEEAWEKNRNKYNEICDTLQPGVWGYRKEDDFSHRTSGEVMGMLEQARAANCNLLLNTGPMADGSIHPDDVKTLRETGKLLRRKA